MRPVLRGRGGCVGFFRTELAGGERLRHEVFYLAYHLHWSWTDILDLDLEERRAYVRLLAARIADENRQLEDDRARA